MTIAANQGPTAHPRAGQIVAGSDDNGSEMVTLIASGSDPDACVSYKCAALLDRR